MEDSIAQGWYSPTLFGVLTEKETPDNTALNDLRKLISCIRLTEIFHLIASNDQFTIINNTTATRLMIFGLLIESRMPCQAISRLGWCFICL